MEDAVDQSSDRLAGDRAKWPTNGGADGRSGQRAQASGAAENSSKTGSSSTVGVCLTWRRRGGGRTWRAGRRRRGA